MLFLFSIPDEVFCTCFQVASILLDQTDQICTTGSPRISVLDSFGASVPVAVASGQCLVDRVSGYDQESEPGMMASARSERTR